jgi:hypothetical protein
MLQQIVVHKPAAQNTALQSLLQWYPWRDAFNFCVRWGYGVITYMVDQHDISCHRS